MAKFFAVTSKGLVDPLFNELQRLDLRPQKKMTSGVWFETDWAGCYRANYFLRTATRILYPVLSFQAANGDELYKQTLRHNFTRYFSVKETFAVHAVGESEVFRDVRYAALKVKDAIVDQFRERYGMRPNVDKDDPTVEIHVKVNGERISLAIDTSGASLSQHGYRKDRGEAPLREHLAAGILSLINWDGQQPIVDLMCGSGTFLIEAAMAAQGRVPGLLRKRYAFQAFENFDRAKFDETVQLGQKTICPSALKFYGFDHDSSALKAAKENAKRAGVLESLEFLRCDIAEVKRPCESGIVLINPPYGERLGSKTNLRELYYIMGQTLKTQFSGWTCWLLSGNPTVTEALSMKSSLRLPVYNGNIECRLLKYEIRDDSAKPA